MLEAMACREVLALAEDLMIQNVIIASDSTQVVNGIERGSSSTYGCIISEIKQQASLINCKFTFEGRASNTDADRLAKFSNTLDQGRHLWFIHPMILVVYHFMWTMINKA